MVDDRGRAVLERLERAEHRRPADHLQVERRVEAPPDLLEDLLEARRRPWAAPASPGRAPSRGGGGRRRGPGVTADIRSALRWPRRQRAGAGTPAGGPAAAAAARAAARVAHREARPADAVEGVERARHGRRRRARAPPRPRPWRRTGPRAAAPRRGSTSTGGMPAAGMMPSDLSVSVTGTPPSITNASVSA